MMKHKQAQSLLNASIKTNVGAQNKKKQTVLVLVISVILLILTFVLGMKFGSVDVSFFDTLKIIYSKIGGGNLDEIKRSNITIIWDLRLPRMILALAAGGGLAVCGVAMQALTQNVLAEPYILGISSGASMMVALAYLLIGKSYLLGTFLPFFSFAGSILVMILVYHIGLGGRKASTTRLVVVGMAVSLILNAITNLIMSFLPRDGGMMNVMLWMWGSLSEARWNNITLPLLVSFSGALFFSVCGRHYNLMSLGSVTASSLGVNVGKWRQLTVLVISLLTGIIVASSGLIGFVGFVIPHAVRLLIGADHRRVFPASFITGGLFLAWMDILSRSLLAPREISIGIFSALFGGPVFMFLLYKSKKKAGI